MKSTDPRFLKTLLCPKCGAAGLQKGGDRLTCEKCRAHYPVTDGVPYLIHEDLLAQYQRYQKEVASPVNKLKTLIKKSPGLFQFLTYAIGSISYFGWSPRKALKNTYSEEAMKDKVILNIGSGIKMIHPEVINVDIFPYRNVGLVTDATKLPIADNSVDMVVTESTLEHIPDAELAMREIGRVVKPGGYVYISIPFLLPFHASPNDYIRLTSEGIRHKFATFEQQRAGMNGGPASALVSLLMHMIALPFSLISESAYHFVTYVVMVPLSPLRLLDLVFYLFPRSKDAAAMTYFIGKKK